MIINCFYRTDLESIVKYLNEDKQSKMNPHRNDAVETLITLFSMSYYCAPYKNVSIKIK
ncbi:MAG: hypothetical protein RL368_524 [Pseudomonadota bacterium]|jgi:hypothetical protein